MIWAWIETSSALIGSSATIRSGLQRQRARDPDALPLAARELVRVARRVVRVEADRREQLADALAPLGRLADVVDVERLGDDPAGGHPRVEAGVRVLEDHLHPAPQAAQVRALELGDVLAVEEDPAAGRRVEPDDRPSGRALAAARTRRRARASRRARSRTMTPSTAWTSPMWRWRMIPSRIGKQTFRSSSRRSGTAAGRGRRAGRRRRRPTSVVMEDPVVAVVLGLGRERQPAGRRRQRDRPLLGLDLRDEALEVVGRRRAARLRPRRSRPAAARPARSPGAAAGRRPRSSTVGGLKQAIRWVAPGPVMTTGVPAIVGRSGRVLRPADVEAPAAARRERADGRRAAHVRRPALDRDERLALDARRRAGSSAAGRPCTDATAPRTGRASSPSRRCSRRT